MKHKRGNIAGKSIIVKRLQCPCGSGIRRISLGNKSHFTLETIKKRLKRTPGRNEKETFSGNLSLKMALRNSTFYDELYELKRYGKALRLLLRELGAK